MYVVAIDHERNAVIIGSEDELFFDELAASGMNWIAIPALQSEMQVTARVRHAARDTSATVRPGPTPSEAIVRFTEPQRAAAPGQAVALYDGERVLGGGIIAQVRRLAALRA